MGVATQYYNWLKSFTSWLEKFDLYQFGNITPKGTRCFLPKGTTWKDKHFRHLGLLPMKGIWKFSLPRLHTLLISALWDRGRRVSVHLRQAWSTIANSDQPGLHRKTLYQKLCHWFQLLILITKRKLNSCYTVNARTSCAIQKLI